MLTDNLFSGAFAESVTLNIAEPVDTYRFDLPLMTLKTYKTVHPHK